MSNSITSLFRCLFSIDPLNLTCAIYLSHINESTRLCCALESFVNDFPLQSSRDSCSVLLAVHPYYFCSFRIPLAVCFLVCILYPGQSAQESKVRVIPAFKLLKNKFVSRLLLAKIFIEPVWYFVTF
jgi:hypothetical protein